MEYLTDLFQYFTAEKNQATLSGLIDIIAVKQNNGIIKSLAFHARFGTLKIINWQKSIVKISINGILQEQEMSLNEYGSPFFSYIKDKETQKPIFLKNQEQIQKYKNLGIQIFKSLRPDNDLLQKFNLKMGLNTIKYEVNDKFMGNQSLEGRIFLYDNTAKLVISDIDGTVTKSDVLGHLFNVIGKQWFHDDIAELHNKIQNNGYQMVYLTARPLVQYYYTIRQFDTLEQNGFKIPLAPCLLSPDLLVSSFKREIVYKTADQFKAALLVDLKNLFEPGTNPLYAGFGNKDTDAIGGLYAGISKEQIYTINHQGHIIHMKDPKITLTYKILKENIEDYFPKLDNIKKQEQKQDQQQL